MHGWLILTVVMASSSPKATDPLGVECADTLPLPHHTQLARVTRAVEKRGCRASVVLMQYAELLARECLVRDRKVCCEAERWLAEAGKVDKDFLTQSAATNICRYQAVWLERKADAPGEEDAACQGKALLEPMTFVYGNLSPRDLRPAAKRVYDRLSPVCRRRDVRRLEQSELAIGARLTGSGSTDFDAALAEAAKAATDCASYEQDRERAGEETRAMWLDAAPLCARLRALTRTPRRPPLEAPRPEAAPRQAPTPPATPTDRSPSIDALMPKLGPVQPMLTICVTDVDRTARALGMAAGGSLLVGATLFVTRIGRDDDDALTEVGAPLMLLSGAVLGAVAIVLETEEAPRAMRCSSPIPVDH